MSTKKQIFYIIFISIFFSIVRYFFIEEEYPIIKPANKASVETYSADASIDSLKNYLNDIKEPKIIDLELAKKIHENNLATFIDARDEESFNEGHIKGAVHLTYEMSEQFADDVDIEWLLELGDNYILKMEVNEEKLLFIGMENSEPFISRYIDDLNLDSVDFLYKPGVQNNQTIFIVYCSGEGCSLSEELAFYMHDRFKINKILIYEGGMPEWIENGLPIE